MLQPSPTWSGRSARLFWRGFFNHLFNHRRVGITNLHTICYIHALRKNVRVEAVFNTIPSNWYKDFYNFVVLNTCFHFYHSTITKPGAPKPEETPAPPPDSR